MHRTEGLYNNGGLFDDGPPGTRVEERWLNSIQEEIAYVIEQNGLALLSAAADTRTQLYQAIGLMIPNNNSSSVTSNYTITDIDNIRYLFVDPTDGDVTITLPTLADNQDRVIKIIVTDLGGKVTVDGEGAETIGGYASLYLQSKSDYLEVIAEAGEWQIVSYYAKYDTGWINTNDWTNRHLGTSAFDYDNKSTSFIVGEVITEATSGNTGIIQSDDGTTIYVKNVTGTGIWTNDREITGSTSGCTADVDEGAGSNKNQDTNILHNLGVDIYGLEIVKFMFSPDKTEANTYMKSSSSGYANDGSTVYGVDSDNVKFQTGSNNVGGYFNDSGTGVGIDTEDWYYRMIIEVII